MPNHLANESSPYLLQHVDNPVDWHPWGEEALALARQLDKPILLSIGYAACHWCHVMAHESFEDEDTAAYMNQHFVNIKVDREERPDLDSIYMGAVQAMTGQGGWPMTVVLTPEGAPFYGGTYFPPQPRYGMPSFKQVLSGVVHAWNNRRDEINESARGMARHLGRGLGLTVQDENSLPAGLMQQAFSKLSESYDAVQGGFGGAPKFPPSMILEFLIRLHLASSNAEAIEMVEKTLTKIAFGGIYDQLGGGFARYSTDNDWLVPHFEKMLYDNALLSRVYLHAWQVTGNPTYRRVCEETLDFVAREMRHSDGGFYSSYDADSEGQEGKFYVWSPDEIRAVLGKSADLFMLYYDVREGGNWEGVSILNVPRAPEEVARIAGLDLTTMMEELAAARKTLYDARYKRVKPGLDEKIITAWNGLMLASFADAGRVLNRKDYIEVASSNAQFLRQTLRRADGRLWRTWKEGAGAKHNGFLEDYAFLADGLLAMYQCTFDESWFEWSHELAALLMSHFWDEVGKGFFETSDDHEALIHRPKELQDNAIPSGNAMAAHVLLRLSLYTGNSQYWERGERMVVAMRDPMAAYPSAFAHWLCGAALIMGDPRELAIFGQPDAADTRALLDVVNARYRPGLVVAVGNDGEVVPLLAQRSSGAGTATAYVCRRFVCKEPVTEPTALAMQLEA